MALHRALVLFLGWGFAVFGGFELFDDLLAALVLLALGLYLLSHEQPWVRSQRRRLEARFPDAARSVAAGERKLVELHGRVTGEAAEQRDRSG